MGSRGPLPKRTEELKGHGAAKAREAVVSTPAPAGTVEAPSTPDDLDPIAAEWFESLKVSGQAQFYEPSDWAAAVYVAKAMTRQIRDRKFSAIAFSAIWAAMGELLTTEGARRRARMEVQRGAPEGEDPAVTAMAEYRARLRGSS